MVARRSLADGLKQTVDPELEKKFVHGTKAEPDQPAKPEAAAPTEAREGKGPAQLTRVPFTTRVRADYASALKRASLERQLSGEEPNTLQDILEEALEPWLKKHGYVS
jgi:hypothetical protein